MTISRGGAIGRADGWMLAGAAAGLTLGQLVPGDASSLAAGSGLPQVAVWLAMAAAVSWVKPVLATGTSNHAAWPGRSSFARLARAGCCLWGGLLLWLLLSTLSVAGRGNSRLAITYWWQWVGMTAAAFVLWSVVRWCRGGLSLLPLMAALAFASSLQGIYQVAVSLPRDQARYRLDPDRVLAEAGLVAPPGSSARLLFESRLFTPDALGPFALGNSLGGLLMIWLLLLVGLCCAVWERRHNRESGRSTIYALWPLLGVVVVSLWLAVGLLLSGSRSAWLSMVVGGVLWVLWFAYRSGGWQRFFWSVGLGALAGVAVGAGGWFAGVAEHPRLSSAVASAQYRWQYWQASARMVSEQPWLGVGPGNFQGFYPRYKLESASETVIDPHNFWVETWATGGIPAGVLLLAVLALGLYCSSRRLFMLGAPSKPDAALDLESTTRLVDRVIDRTSSHLGPGGGVLPRSGWAVSAAWVTAGSLSAASLLWLAGGVLGDPPALEDWWWAGGLGLLVLWALSRLGDQLWGGRQGLGASVTLGPAWLAAAGLIAAGCGLLHLLASGGWLSPGCINSVCLLGAVSFLGGTRAGAEATEGTAVGVVGAVQSAAGASPGSGPAARWLSRIAAYGWLWALAAFLWTGWMPVLAVAGWQRQALFLPATSLDSALERAERAIASDRLAPEPRLELARLRATQLLLAGGGGAGRGGASRERGVDRDGLARFDEAIQQYLAVDPASWVAWQTAAELNWGLPLEGSAAAARAVDLLRVAIDCYPSNSALLVQAAAAATLAEQWADAERWADGAERLERNNTHLDRSLAYQSVFVPVPSLQLEWLRGIMGRSVDGRVAAEPLLAALRSRIESVSDR